MPFRIIRNKDGYFVENIDTGRRFSKKPMTEQSAKKQFKILNKYLHTLEGSGLNKGEIKEIKQEALTDADIREYLPNVKIISHQDLKDYNSIDELLPNKKDIVIIIYESKPNNGHWCLLSKYDNTIEYFDSYSNPIDEPLKWIDKKYKNTIDNTPYLSNLLKKAKNKYDIVYNAKPFQSERKDIATCGRHCIFRAVNILNDNQDLSNYIKMMNELKNVTGFNYDDIVSNAVSIRNE